MAPSKLKTKPLKIEPLKPHHDRVRFDCGVESLNIFLQRYARQNANKELGITYVAVDAPGDVRINGYFTLSTGSVVRDALSEPGLPQYPVPTVLLGRLAVDRNRQGQGVGGLLLTNALRLALQTSGVIGVFAVEVFALDDAARAFYLRYGFQSMDDDPLHLYLPMKAIRTMGLSL